MFSLQNFNSGVFYENKARIARQMAVVDLSTGKVEK
jgi:hypothetical protein